MTTELIEGIAEVIDSGYGCIGGMAWESAYIVFRVYPDETSETPLGEYRWHSDNVERILYQQDRLTMQLMGKGDTWFDLKIRVRGDKVWRVLDITYR